MTQQLLLDGHRENSPTQTYCLLYPLILIYTGISEFIIRYVLRLKVDREEYKFSTVDLNDYIAEYADAQEADEDMQQEIQLFQNVMEFRSVKLRECMGPRNEIESVKLTDTLEAVKARFEETKHSKLIVIGESIDDIVGYVHLNDVVRAIAEHRDVTMNDLVRRIDFFPETYTADRLLKHFIQKRQGVAAVVDEFGGTAGIVTMEDVVDPSPENFSIPGIEPRSPTLQADSLSAKPQGKPKNTDVGSLSLL